MAEKEIFSSLLVEPAVFINAGGSMAVTKGRYDIHSLFHASRERLYLLHIFSSAIATTIPATTVA